MAEPESRKKKDVPRRAEDRQSVPPPSDARRDPALGDPGLGDIAADGVEDAVGRAGLGDADLEAPPSLGSERPARSMIEHILDFVAFVGKQMPLTALLDGVPARFGAILAADVVSLYLLEGEGENLVLRANVGFTKEAQGRIRLHVGEGLTGLAVEQKRPVAVVRATRHDKFRRFAELDEDRFPIFLAAPIIGAEQRALGALVVQRREHPFSEAEVALATALTAPIAYAVRHAALLDELRDKPVRRTGGGTRKVTLPGKPIVPGRALGAVTSLRRPAKDRKQSARKDEVKLVRAAFDAVEKGILGLEERARSGALGEEGRFLAGYALIASDSRLRERTLELIGNGKGSAEALSTVAREVTRAATGIVGDPFLAERSRDIEDFCDAVLMLASPDARAEQPTKAVLIGDDFTVFDLLVTARTQPAGVVLTERASPRGVALLKLMGVPAIVDVQGAFHWASPGDVALLDADHGFFVVNPSRAEVSALRAYRRDHEQSGR
jgi:phosphotransferase system enzyme I (PtsP)